MILIHRNRNISMSYTFPTHILDALTTGHARDTESDNLKHREELTKNLPGLNVHMLSNDIVNQLAGIVCFAKLCDMQFKDSSDRQYLRERFQWAQKLAQSEQDIEGLVWVMTYYGLLNDEETPRDTKISRLM